jgi:hypothetical protein
MIHLGAEATTGERMLGIAFQPNGATVTDRYRPGARVGAVVWAGAVRNVNRKLGRHAFEGKPAP